MKKLSFIVGIMLVFFSCTKLEVRPYIEDDKKEDNGSNDNGSNNNGGNDINISSYYDIPDYIKGVDLSYINQIEDKGGVYKEDGEVVDPYELFGRKGANVVRIRVWHNPIWHKSSNVYGENSELYSYGDDIKKSIRRAKENGMAVLLDFHYSDTWADPGKQTVPEAWKNITSMAVLEDSIYNYTYKVMDELLSEDLLPEMVQVGNETNCGMMITNTNSGFPSLNTCNGEWANMGKAVNSAISAIRDIDKKSGKKTTIALHVADPKNLDRWLGDAIKNGKITDFEIMGVSFYHIWHTQVSFANLPTVIKTAKKNHNKEIVIMETAYPFTSSGNDSYNNIYYDQDVVEDFAYTVAGQYEFMKKLNENMVDAGAKGVFYWEPAWISSNLKDEWGQGSSWENCAFFDFSGEVTSAIDYLTIDYLK